MEVAWRAFGCVLAWPAPVRLDLHTSVVCYTLDFNVAVSGRALPSLMPVLQPHRGCSLVVEGDGQLIDSLVREDEEVEVCRAHYDLPLVSRERRVWLKNIAHVRLLPVCTARSVGRCWGLSSSFVVVAQSLNWNKPHVSRHPTH